MMRVAIFDGAMIGAVLVAVSFGAAAPVAAQVGQPKPHAAVAIVAPEQTDSFVIAYLFEVAATVLRSEGYVVAPPNATRELVGELSVGAGECLGDLACGGPLARALGAPMILVVEAVPVSDGQLSVQILSAVVTHEGIERSDPVVLSASETDVAEAVRDATATLAAIPAPCHLDVAAPPDLQLRITVGGARPATDFPLFLAPGEHRLTVSGIRRTDWAGAFTCAAGRRYRVSVR